jgi:hypothetical protein
MNRGLDVLAKAGLAIGGLSLIVFLIGHIGLLTAPYIALSVVVVSAAFAWSIRGAIGRNAAQGAIPRVPWSATEMAMLAAALGFVVAALLLAATPPSVRDELIQHLALPKLYLKRGAIYEIPFMGFSYLPQNIDLLYIIPMAFGSDTAPRVMHLAFSVLTGLVVYFHMLPWAGRGYSLAGLTLFVSMPLAFNLSRMAYVDLGAAFYTAAGVAVALRRRDVGGRRLLVYSALLMGLAASAKLNALIALVLVCGLASFRKGRGAKDALRDSALYLAVAVAVVSPWLIRNYAWKGSPFYPVIDSALRAAARGEGFHVTGEIAPLAKRTVLYGEGVLDLALLPLRIFWEGRDNSIERFDGVLNPLYLLFIPLLFLRRNVKDIRYLAVFVILFFALATLTADLVTRYLMPAMPAFIVLAAAGFRNLSETRRLKAAAVALILLTLAFNVRYVAGLYQRLSPFGYLTGAVTRDEYLTAALPDYEAVMRSNRILPPGAAVMLLFAGDRGYYWEREYYFPDRTGLLVRSYIKRSRDAAELGEKMKRRGVTHLFVNDALFGKFVADNFGAEGGAFVSGFFAGHAERVLGSNGFSLYALR